jgi:hypothetical protein
MRVQDKRTQTETTMSSATQTVVAEQVEVPGICTPGRTVTVRRLDPVVWLAVRQRRRFAGLTAAGNVLLADNAGQVTGETTPKEMIRAYA